MSLMLINPRKRRTRSAAQRAATKRMIAANRARRASNPRKRRAKRHSVSRRRHNPIRTVTRTVHRRSRRHRNPIGKLSTSNITGMLLNGLKGAGGAVVVNVATNYLPDAVKTGKVVYVTRAALAILLGTVGSKVLGKHARPMAEGALTVNFHDFINTMAGSMLPGSDLRGMGEYITNSGGYNALPKANSGSFDSELHGMGEYISY